MKPLNWMPPWCAVLLPTSALGVQWLCWPWLQPFVWFLFYPAVFFSSWMGGLRGGLYATALSTLIVWYFFIPPQYSFVIQDYRVLLSVVMFIGMGVLFAVVHERVRRTAEQLSEALNAVQTANLELETRVLERTAELGKSRESIQQSEERMSGIVSSAMDAIISIDSEQVIVLFNAAAEAMYRCAAAEALGQPLERFIPQRFRQAHKQHVAEFGQTGVTSRSMSSPGVLSGVRADGEEFPIEASISQTEVAGQKLYTVILRDITQRREDEAATALLAAIVESSSDAIVGKDLHSTVTSWNAGAESMFGYAASEIIGRSITLIIPQDRQDEEVQILSQIKRGERVEHFETMRQTKAGGRISVSVSVSPIRDGRGQIIGASKVARNITERQIAAKALKESEERLRIVTENAGLGLVIVNRERRYEYANRFYADLVGRPQPGIIGQRLADVLGDFYEEPLRALLDRAFSGERVKSEVILPMQEGGRHLSFTYEPWHDQGEVSLVIAVIMDITERSKAEKAMRDQEIRLHAADRRLAEIMHGMTEACFALDAEWRFTFVNERSVTLLRHPKEDMLGKCMWEVFNKLNGTPMEAHYRRAMTERVALSFEVFSPIAERWLDIRLFPTVEGVAAFLMDITARKEAEGKIQQMNAELEERVMQRTAELEAANTELTHNRAELKSLFESLPGLYLVLTPEFRIVAVSDAYLKATMTTREGILGRGLFEVFPDNPDEPNATGEINLRTSLNHVLENGVPHTMAIQKYDIRRPDGEFEERYWSPINSPVLGADRKIQYIIHRVEEVTEFVRSKAQNAGNGDEFSARMQLMEAEIFQSSQKVQTANRLLEAANKELESFSYSVSHDLRAPLRAMDGFSRAVLEDYGKQLPADGLRYLQIIRTSAQRMGDLIDDLLSFSRLSRASMSKRTMDVSKLVNDVLEDLKSQREGRMIELRIGGLPECEGDPALLKQVWINLLSNAIKYTQKREAAVIEVGCKQEEQTNIYFVRDNGTGFDMRYAHKLFGVFQRLHRAEDYDGTGVGLAIVQRIIHRHGGKVWAKAVLDQGATFYFTLEGENPL